MVRYSGMNFRGLLLIGFVTLAFSSDSTFSDEIRGEKKVSDATDPLLDRTQAAMKQLEANNLEALVHDLVPNDDRADFRNRLLQAVTDTRLAAHAMVGEPLAKVEFLKDEFAGESYRRLSFGEKFEGGMVVYRFTFYRTDLGWQLEWFNRSNGDDQFERGPNPIPEAPPFSTAQKIMNLIAEGNFKEADRVMRGCATKFMLAKWNPETPEKMELTERLNALNGNPSLEKVDFLGWESLGPSLVRFRFSHRHKRIGNSWALTFYRGSDEWALVDCNFRIEDRDPSFFATKPLAGGGVEVLVR